jgi:hypothetical protein
MVRLLAKLLGLVIGLSVVGAVAGAIAAASQKKKAPPPPDLAADEIDLVTIMDGIEFASAATAFRGGRVTCWYAGVDLDLREATLDPGGADLEVRTAFGGTRVVVAPGVPVTVAGPAIFGGRSNAAGDAPTGAGAPVLRITGFTVFGGLQVVASERGEEIPAWTGEHGPAHEHRNGGSPAAPAHEPTADVAPA